ncbi:Type III pantothenate kinase [Candidatus Methylobacter favarea]|uniref:Type III pantothenate kinase n=1 Tax=Candidatus Methylobacter favarea TaxID=2707345 RepID=A0A8S0WQJ3_9GAMM|nr:type III pantothenate kinase [Candidatus Methylobacter favarea]CAA9891479.1 Type III pantothenate kinase [Candidatus Methylobacter favarea]
MNLLVDIGNTRLKWGLAEDSHITSGQSQVHHQLDSHKLIEIWKKIAPPRQLAISCVSSSRLVELVRAVAVELWPDIDISIAQSQAQAFGVYNAYEQPRKLGVDRWLSLVAARRYYPGLACITDCGTAITLDLIDAQGRHLGGLISPGLTLMRKSLAQGTEALKWSEMNYAAGLANFTEAAIHSGTLAAACGLIEHVLATQPENIQLILTGGDAGCVAEQLAYKPIIDPDLVLRGLSIVLEG